MKRILTVAVLSLISSVALLSQEGSDPVFPDDFFGIYKGQLEINSKTGQNTIDMEFHLQPTDSVGKYVYKLVYIAEGNRQERDYNLIEQNMETGEYIVDENNGIILDDKVLDNKLYSVFEVNGSFLMTLMTFGEDHMVFEIIFSSKKDKRVTYPDSDPDTEVISYPVSTIQRAVLQKQ